LDPGTERTGVVRHLAGRQRQLGHPGLRGTLHWGGVRDEQDSPSQGSLNLATPPGLVHHDRPLVVDLIELTLDHGVVVRAAQNVMPNGP
jgi:hypothetical protein